jgi:hypothetical protein
MCSMTSKGSIVGQLHRAIAPGDLLAVRGLAGELPEVPLGTAAEITLPEAKAVGRSEMPTLAGERACARSA